MSPLANKLTSHKGLAVALAATALLVLGGGVFLSANDLRSSVVNTIDSSTYQAVHLDNSETYFGKITSMDDNYVNVTDVFYFLDETKKTLVKRGDESLVLNRAHVLATENLEDGNAVLQAILKYKSNKN
ncbi:MAG: hypothetical protein WCV72_01695 [Patescibacteria group bacterium]